MANISIITPVFNREDCIERCLDSVKKQKGGFEQVVVNDGSSDATGCICEDFAKNNIHLHYITFNHNRGTNAARNAAIAAAKYEWCMFLDSDDELLPQAILQISDYIDAHPEGRHFAFAPDDMQAYYRTNAIIAGRDDAVLTYPDFLQGNIGGDFIHVMRTDTLRKFPFDERLRIYEGVFFLSFYREAGSVLYRNIVVAHRDRGRADSVSREYIRTSRKAIADTALSSEILLERFGGEMNRLGMAHRINEVRTRLLECYTMLGQYGKAKVLFPLTYGYKSRILNAVCHMHAGRMYRAALYCYLKTKYRLVKMK